MTKSRKKNLGSSLEAFLKDEGIYQECNAVAVKRVLAWELEQTMEKENISKTKMAERLKTSRSQLNKLLDPQDTGVTLSTMQKVAECLGKQLKLELVA